MHLGNQMNQMRRVSISIPEDRESFDEDETAQVSPTPIRKDTFDDPEYSQRTTCAIQSEPSRSRHGFFSEFEMAQPATLQSTYSLQSLKPGPDQTFKEKYNCKISSILPIVGWLPSYKVSWFKADFIAAITVSILQVPQVLAYATLAGLPPEWGLYASVIPVLLYGIWSTSTVTSVGPGAPSAIMVASAVNSVMASMNESASDEELYQCIAMTFTFCCGIIFITLGLMRAGVVIVFLSRPVMTGFIMSASFIIVLSQCRNLFGLDIGRYPVFTENFYAIILNLHTIHWVTTLISMLSLFVLFIPKFVSHIPKWVPFPLIVMVVNIVLSYIFDFESLGVAIVGDEIKSGIPMPSAPNFKFLGAVFPSALVVTIVDYMSNIILANSFQQKVKDRYVQQLNETAHGSREPLDLPLVNVDANMEFLAYGIANLLGSFFSSQLISASFSRTALNYEMSGHTRIAGFIRAFVCFLCLLFLMPFLSPLPSCVLASVVWTAVYRLIRSGVVECKFLYFVSKLELIEFIVSVIAPLIVGMEMGIFLAIATSIIVNLLRHTFANVIFLGRLKTNKNAGGTEYVNCKLFKQSKIIPHVIIIEMKAELSFSNNTRLVNKIRELLCTNEKYIIVSLNLTSFIDTTAIRQIVTLFQDAKNAHICLSQCRPKVIELINRYQSQMSDNFPPNVKTFISTHDAVRYLQKMRGEITGDISFTQTINDEDEEKDEETTDSKFIYHCIELSHLQFINI